MVDLAQPGVISGKTGQMIKTKSSSNHSVVILLLFNEPTASYIIPALQPDVHVQYT